MYEVDQYRDAYREGLFARALGLSSTSTPIPSTRERLSSGYMAGG